MQLNIYDLITIRKYPESEAFILLEINFAVLPMLKNNELFRKLSLLQVLLQKPCALGDIEIRCHSSTRTCSLHSPYIQLSNPANLWRMKLVIWNWYPLLGSECQNQYDMVGLRRVLVKPTLCIVFPRSYIPLKIIFSTVFFSCAIFLLILVQLQLSE